MQTRCISASQPTIACRLARLTLLRAVAKRSFSDTEADDIMWHVSMSRQQVVAVVTGASRGAGKGIERTGSVLGEVSRGRQDDRRRCPRGFVASTARSVRKGLGYHHICEH